MLFAHNLTKIAFPQIMVDKKQVTAELNKIVEDIFKQLIQVKDLLVVLEAESSEDDEYGSEDTSHEKHEEEGKEKGGKAPRQQLLDRFSQAKQGKKRRRGGN